MRYFQFEYCALTFGKEAVAQYRDAVNKLKNSTNAMKGCIAQLQDLRVKEKKESEEKVT